MSSSRKIKFNKAENDGFEEWGGYMEAKKSKLMEQFKTVTCNSIKPLSHIFRGVAIHVNGYTNPSANELKNLMASHGGEFHLYQMPTTTHIIASNLPNVKVKQLGNIPIINVDWISDSLRAEKLLDYTKYLLYSNVNSKQPKLAFTDVTTNEKDTIVNSNLTVNLTKQGSSNICKTASDSNFLTEFYNNSRLHLISTLRTELKQLVSRLREESDGIFPSLKKLQIEKMPSVNYNVPIVMHIDMDCFFVSVGLRRNPQLRGMPVAVTHARNSQTSMIASKERLMEIDSMSEISSCSYEARKYGIKNGMFLGAAIKLCPNLKTIPYDFEGYREVSYILYRTVASYTLDIEAVSCDEMYVNVGPILKALKISVSQWATHIREAIMKATNCPCSTGFGSNRLQARLATRKAKPSGQFYLQQEQLDKFMADTNLIDLPGVGFATISKLKSMGLMICGDVQKIPLARLQTELGQKTGIQVFEQAQGIDRKPLNFQYKPKSVSVDVNYGIRFHDKEQALNFLKTLSNEVWNRLQEINMKAKCVTLKLLVRASHAPQETPKFLGCGICDSINRSANGKLLSDYPSIFYEVKTIFEQLNVPPKELRGIGIHLTKLEKIVSGSYNLSQFLSGSMNKNACHLYENDDKLFVEKETSNEGVSLHKELYQDLSEEKRCNLAKITTFKEQIDEANFFTTNLTVFDDLRWKDLQIIVTDWLNSGHGPNKFDVTMLAQYLKQFVFSRKLEKLQQMLTFLYRRISKLKLCLWHEAYETILKTVQEGMLKTYGNTLKADHKFNCLNHGRTK